MAEIKFIDIVKDTSNFHLKADAFFIENAGNVAVELTMIGTLQAGVGYDIGPIGESYNQSIDVKFHGLSEEQIENGETIERLLRFIPRMKTGNN